VEKKVYEGNTRGRGGRFNRRRVFWPRIKREGRKNAQLELTGTQALRLSSKGEKLLTLASVRKRDKKKRKHQLGMRNRRNMAKKKPAGACMSVTSEIGTKWTVNDYGREETK